MSQTNTPAQTLHEFLRDQLANRFELETVTARESSFLRAAGKTVENDWPVHFACSTDLEAAELLRIEYAMSRIAKISSQSLPRYVDFACTRDALVLVHDAVNGKCSYDYVCESTPDLNTALNISLGMFTGLRDLHEVGVYHLGIQPKSVVVGEDSQATLLYNTRPIRQAAHSQLGVKVQQAYYLSPEQAGSIDRAVEATADLYSAGAVLFFLLTGRPPFLSCDLGSLLLAHMATPIPKLSELGFHGIPDVVQVLLERLLAKDPDDRYQTADGVLHDLNEIIRQLQVGVSCPQVPIGHHDFKQQLVEPAFVARQQELDEIFAAMETSKGGTPSFVFLEGKSGAGKSRLLWEVCNHAKTRGFEIFKGQGTNDVTKGPFSILDGVVDTFIAGHQSESKESAGAQEFQDDLVSMFPRFRQSHDDETSTEPKKNPFATAAISRAFSTFLSSLGNAEQPAIVILDDCQWACQQTIGMLKRLQSELAAKDCHVLFLLAFRSEEVGAKHPLRQLKPSVHAQLTGLSRDEVRKLATSMAGELPEEVLSLVETAAAGSPFMAVALMRGLVESGAIEYSNGEWRTDENTLEACQSSTRAGEFLTRRLDLLSGPTLSLLSAGAVIGRAFELPMAVNLTSQDSFESMSWLSEACNRHMVWLHDDQQCVFSHDKIREALLSRLSAAELKAIHGRAAQYLMERSSSDAGEIAYHFDAAEQHADALPHALAAAKQAQDRGSPATAKQQFLIAERGVQQSSSPSETQFLVQSGLGSALMLLGEYTEAEKHLEQAFNLAGSKLEQAKIRGVLAETARKRGDLVSAADNYELALDMLGYVVPKSKPAVFALVLREILNQVRNSLFPKLFLHWTKRSPNESERLCLTFLSGLAHTYWYIRGKSQTLWAHFACLNLSERFEPSLEMASAYAEHAPCMTLLGQFRRAEKYVERSYEIRKSFDDIWGQGQSRCFQAVTYYAASRFEDAIAMGRDSIRLLEQAGDYWTIHIARFQVAASLLKQGRYDEAKFECETNYASAVAVGDEAQTGVILDLWARANQGDIPQDVLDDELERERVDVQGRCHVLMASCLVQIRNGELKRAAEFVDEAIRSSDERGVKNCYTIAAYSLRSRVLREQAEQLSGSHQGYERVQLLRQALKGNLVGILNSWASKNELPKLLQELGLIRLMQGAPHQARWCLRMSRSFAKKIGCSVDYAESSKLLGQIGHTLGWPETYQFLREGQELLSQMHFESANGDVALPGADRSETLSLADRFDTIVEVGRKIAAALSNDEVFRTVHEAATRLLRCEECCIVQFDRGRPQTVFGSGNIQVRRDTVVEVVKTRNAISDSLIEPELAGGDGEGSLLCTPIFVLGEVRTLIYSTHSQVRDLFGENEVRLAQFIATLAGASLENALGYSQLQELNVTLEDRVAERTQAAESRARELAESNSELERTADDLRRTEEQLRQAVAEATAASEAKTRFLATMSHEIRTPMNGILGMAELALATDLDATQSKYVKVVKQSGQTLLTLLNEILDLSKIEAGKVEIEHIEFEVREIAENAVQLFSPAAHDKGLEIICEIDHDVPVAVQGDPNRIRQIIVNLVGNAIKFTSQGEIHVAVKSCADDQLEFSIRDTGIGIAPEKQHLIFEAFQQEDSSTTRQYGGTGLGLSICQQLAQLMGGCIRVESVQGKGSSFSFSLPLKASGPRLQQDLANDRFRGHTMLLVCEQQSVSLASQKLFECLGFHVLTLSSIDELDADTVASVDLVAVNQPSEYALSVLASHPNTRSLGIIHAGETVDDGLAVVTKPLCLTEVQSVVLELVQGVNENLVQVEKKLAKSPTKTSSGRRILVADDCEVNQEVARGLLEIEGFDVEVASNGREVIEQFEALDIDLILMDVEMPIMDGMEATRRIRKTSSVPIVALSAHAVEDLMRRCEDVGFDDYISKPFQPDEMIGKLNKLLQQATASLGTS